MIGLEIQRNVGTSLCDVALSIIVLLLHAKGMSIQMLNLDTVCPDLQVEVGLHGLDIFLEGLPAFEGD